MSNRLAEILENKRSEISRLDSAALRWAAESAPRPWDFLAALQSHSPQPVRLIAELKRASPSKGLLAGGLDLRTTARIYVENGAAAISVLTDENISWAAWKPWRHCGLRTIFPFPLLRKDFIIDPVQVYQSRAGGADAVLLIAAALPEDAHLAELHALALSLGLAPLVEVHSEQEVERVLKLEGLKMVGINNRNLATFQVTLDTTELLRPLIPSGVVVIAESGIFTAQDVTRMAAAGVNAVLVGEALVTAPDIASKVRELSGRAI